MYQIEHLVMILLLAAPSAEAQTASSAADRDAFRVRSTSVPVDVTVLDGSGNPRLDLAAADFEIFEDGKPQKLAHFVPPLPGTQATETGQRSSQPVETPQPEAPREPRYFLILLGNMGHDDFQSLRDVADFVTELGPRDRVALMAFRRLGNLNGDHRKTAEAILRYRKTSKRINAILWHIRKLPVFMQLSPPSRNLPPGVRKAVMEFFEESGFGSRELAPEASRYRWSGLGQSPSDRMRQLDSTAAASMRFYGPDSPGLQSLATPELFPLNPFDEARLKLISDLPPQFAAASSDIGRLDASQILTAIEYLSHLDGDKHLFFLNDRGLDISRTETLERIGRSAAGARVRLHLFQTGGTEPPPGVLANVTAAPWERTGFRLRLGGGNLSSILALAGLRILARDSGGTVSIHAKVAGALRRTLQAINATYRLAYTPTNTNWDGKFRRIEVRVKGKGNRLQYRRGYLGTPTPSPSERLEGLALSRTVAAMKQPDHITEIPLTLAVARRADSGDSSQFEVRLKARFPEGIFRRTAGGWETRIAVAYFVIEGHDVATVRDMVDLTLSEDDYREAQREGFDFFRSLAVAGPMSGGLLKVVVYQPDKDLLGSIDMRLPR